MIRARDLYKIYRADGTEVRALDGVSLEIRRGEFVAIVGRSGAGKTTLLSLLGGLTRPTAGEIHLDGVPLQGLSDGELSRLRAEKIGFVFQSAGLLPTLTALENVLLPGIFAPRQSADPRRKAQRLLDLVGLRAKADRLPSQLSGGEQRRVALARALMNDPVLILADEPTGDLDEQTEGEVLELLGGLNAERGITLVIVTHSPAVAGRACRVLTMAGGRIVKDEPGAGA